MFPLDLEFRDGDEVREFVLDNVNGSRPSEGVVQTFVCEFEVTQAKSRLTLNQRSADEILLEALNTRQLPRPCGEKGGTSPSDCVWPSSTNILWLLMSAT